MPHVILQTTTGLSQMYRIVLEPSLNTSTAQMAPTGQASQANQMPTYSQVQPANGTIVEAQYAINAEDKSTISKQPSYMENKVHIVNCSRKTNMVVLSYFFFFLTF